MLCNSSSSGHVGFLFALFLQISLVCLVSSLPLWMKWSMWPKRWRDWGLQLPFWLEEPPHPSNNSAILTEWPVMYIYHCWMWHQSRAPSIIVVTIFCFVHDLNWEQEMLCRAGVSQFSRSTIQSDFRFRSHSWIQFSKTFSQHGLLCNC